LHASIYPSFFGLLFVAVWLFLVLRSGFGRVNDPASAIPRGLWESLLPGVLMGFAGLGVLGFGLFLAHGEAKEIARILHTSLAAAAPTA
jgi:hypothetical protein